MQLDQILSAAVAAVNVEEVEQLPSPDIPQNSPTPPASARDHRVLHYLPGHGLASTPFEGTPLEAQTEVEGLCHYPPEVPPQELTDVGHTDSTPACASAAEVQHLIDLDTKEAMQVYHEALQDAQPPPDGDLGDMNFFALDDNLVITSQQALEMFESPPAMDYGATYHVLTASENPPQVNTPPMEVGGAVCPEGPTPSEILAQEEIPIQEEVLLQGVGPAPTDVPVPSAEIEVLTTPDVPQYTALAPASATADGAIDLIDPDALQCLPGTALDATVDAEGRFVVQVTAPGINMTVPNRYVGSEDIVVQLPCVAASPPGAEARPHDPPSSTGPYTTQGECPSVYSGPALGPLRESIFRSRAKKRGRGTEGGADKAPKRRPLTPRAEDVCGTKDSGERHEGGRYGVDGPSHYTYETTKRTPHTPAPVSSAAAPYGYDAPAERQGPASPLVVMRPEDLHAGSPDAGDPLQVQLVYLVYPMEGAGKARRGRCGGALARPGGGPQTLLSPKPFLSMSTLAPQNGVMGIIPNRHLPRLPSSPPSAAEEENLDEN
ncbi:hypothetical protein C7M84_015845 [Penaeus vannamei]|uniref:Uncharacterized protein n=1 Tax=Penaeus vannamei TaxID=6689 RepID=A0A3R7M3E1_PENVA|nr:hypothetical protein C7M84_015845 [Penaeus vannamei]